MVQRSEKRGLFSFLTMRKFSNQSCSTHTQQPVLHYFDLVKEVEKKSITQNVYTAMKLKQHDVLTQAGR